MNKSFFFILTLLCLGTPLAAQPWLDLLPKDKPRNTLTLHDYRQAFDTYWAPYDVQDGTTTPTAKK